jgi:hypothetical protein
MIRCHCADANDTSSRFRQVVGDEVADQLCVRQRVRHGVQDAAIGTVASSSMTRTNANIVARSRRRWRATNGM